jgi:predicted ATPase
LSSSVTFLVSENGCGKSPLLEAIDLLLRVKHAMRKWLKFF